MYFYSRIYFFLFSSSFKGMICTFFFPALVICRVLELKWKALFPGILWVKEDEGRADSLTLCVLLSAWFISLGSSWIGGRFPRVALTLSVWEPYPLWIISSNPLHLARLWVLLGTGSERQHQGMTQGSLAFCGPVALVCFSFLVGFFNCKGWYNRESQFEV